MQTVSGSLELNFRVVASRLRLYTTLTSNASQNSARLVADKHGQLDEQEERDALLRKRKTEWKRRQRVRGSLIYFISYFKPDLG
jgi:hypothetical protein